MTAETSQPIAAAAPEPKTYVSRTDRAAERALGERAGLSAGEPLECGERLRGLVQRGWLGKRSCVSADNERRTSFAAEASVF